MGRALRLLLADRRLYLLTRSPQGAAHAPHPITVAASGLGFGAGFVPIDLDHPGVAAVASRAAGERFGIPWRCYEATNFTNSTNCLGLW